MSKIKDRSEVERLEKLIGQLQGLHTEIAVLAKKAPADGVNAFKLKLINAVIKFGNEVLGPEYRPFNDFDEFSLEDVPSTSDVTMVLGQYMEEAERYRSDNVMWNVVAWVYVINGTESDIQTGPPSKIGRT